MPRRNSRNSVGGVNRKNQAELTAGLRDLRHKIDKVNAANQQCKPTLDSINQLHAKITCSDGTKTLTNSQASKLKQLSQEAFDESEVEIEILKDTLAEINRLKELRGDKRHYLVPATRSSDFFSSSDESSQPVSEVLNIVSPRKSMRRGALMTLLREMALSLPLYTGDPDHHPLPPLCGAVPPEPNYVVPTGHYVAAKVKTTDEDIVLTPSASHSKRNDSSASASGCSPSLVSGSSVSCAVTVEESQILNENWILAECAGVLNSSAGGGAVKYEIVDIDDDSKECGKHVLGKRRVVPLPLMKADPLLYPQAVYPKGARVMALYPQTTCFYSAVVHESPQHCTDEYRVLFEDSSYRDGYSPPLCVPVKFVVAVKEPPTATAGRKR